MKIDRKDRQLYFSSTPGYQHEKRGFNELENRSKFNAYDMKIFMRGGTHSQAMRESGDLARSVSSTHFHSDTVPEIAEVKAILADSRHNKS